MPRERTAAQTGSEQSALRSKCGRFVVMLGGKAAFSVRFFMILRTIAMIFATSARVTGLSTPKLPMSAPSADLQPPAMPAVKESVSQSLPQ